VCLFCCIVLPSSHLSRKSDDTFALLTFLGVDSISDAAVFREKITKPIKAGKGVGLSRLRCALAQVTLRRTKQTTDIQLVAREKKLVKINFPEGSHKQVHDALFTSSKAVFDALGKGDAEKMTFKTHGKMFEQLLRIRQACCSGELVPIDRRNSALQVARHLKLKGNSGPLDSTSANALLERLTGDAAVDAGAATTAPMGTPPKVEAMLKLIGDMAPDEKGVVFSQFVSFLDIIQHHLEANGHSTTRLTGSMNAKQRIESMELFEKQDTTKARFVLCQIKAAGQGINLDRANVVFMMDPWYVPVPGNGLYLSGEKYADSFVSHSLFRFNQAVLEQAMDRVHRLSQTRPVRVYSLVMAHTIEDRLLTVAKRKEMMGKGTLMKLTEEEERHAKMTQMRDLFDVEDEEEGEEISV
jgi:SNF2 family DNA or RNA helicase